MWEESEDRESQQTEEDNLGMEMIDLHGTGSERKKEAEQEKAAEEEKINPLKEAVSLIGTVAGAVLLMLFLKEFVMINAYIPSGSMENTIMTGDRLIGSRLSYLFDTPERGDIVIFKYPDDEEQLFVKRVIGLPGETVVIEDAKVYIGGELLEEDYLKEEWVLGNDGYTFEVPEDSYLVLGDNRNNSKDARYWVNTYVAEDKILGRAVFAYWPVENIGIID